MKSSLSVPRRLFPAPVPSFLFAFFLLPGPPLTAQQTASPPPPSPECIASLPSLAGDLLRQPHWNADGRRLAFLRDVETAKAGPAPQLKPQAQPEVRVIDAADGKQSTLLSSQAIHAVLEPGPPKPAFPADDDDDKAGSPTRLADYAWAPGGQALLLVSPTALAWYDLRAASGHLLVSGKETLSHAALAPDGRTVAFVQQHALWLVAISGGPARRFTPPGHDAFREGEPDWPYENELRLKTAFWWSPDSSRIAWLETDDRAVASYGIRGSDGETRSIVYPKPGGAIPEVHVFVGPVSSSSVIGGLARRMDLGAAKNFYFPRAQWLPDGKHLAVERLDRAQKTLDYFIADTATGKSRIAVTDRDGYWINLSDDLYFFRDSRRFLISSERSGWRHLYLYDTDGRQLAQITHGPWEVTRLDGVDERAGLVRFTATEHSVVERQIYSAPLDGSALTRITQEPGTHEALFSPQWQTFLDTRSDRNTPPRQDLLQADGTKIASVVEGTATPELQALPPVELTTVRLRSDNELHALFIRPPSFHADEKYPVLIYVPGGPPMAGQQGEQVARDAWGGDTMLWLRSMAQRGYLVFALDHHGTRGRGHLFEEPMHYRFSAQEMSDQRDGVLFLQSLPYVDTTRIGICGWDYGGFLVLHGMLHPPLHFKAGFAFAPVVDWNSYDAIFGERYLGDPVIFADGWNASSPLEDAHNLKRPLLLAQGTADEFTHVENTLTLLDHLLDADKYADILLLPDRGHTLDDAQTKQVFYERLTAFFLKNL
jgi:dipeptidyl-peptidase-4